jgi:RNA polymerase sigma factor (sigma-70 family)
MVETIDQNESKFIGATNLAPIVDNFYGPLYQFAVRLTKSESDAADLVQQTFCALVQHLHQIRDQSRIKCWLFITLRRNFLTEVRRRVKHREVEFLPDVHGLQTEDPSHWSTLDALSVNRALLQVNESYRTALQLFYLKNLSYREIGTALEIPIGTVMSRLSTGQGATQIHPVKSYLQRCLKTKNARADISKRLFVNICSDPEALRGRRL